MRLTGIDFSNVHVHQGLFADVVGTVDVGTIALLRLDGDWYESDDVLPASLFPKMARGGYLIIDDYGVWDGCT